MSSEAATMTMSGFFSNESDILFENIPSDSKNFELETTDKALVGLKKYFDDFNFDLNKIKKDIDHVSYSNTMSLPISKFLSEKGNLFKEKIPGFNSTHFFYKTDSNGIILRNQKGEPQLKTMNESIEYLRRMIKIEIFKRKKENNHDIYDLVNFIEHNFITHYLYLLEISFKENLKTFNNYFTSKRFITSKKQQPSKQSLKLKEQNFSYPQEQLEYLRNTLGSVLNYQRRSIEQFGKNLRHDLFGDDFFIKDTEIVEPRMIKKPYIQKEKTTSLIGKMKNYVNSIFGKKI